MLARLTLILLTAFKKRPALDHRVMNSSSGTKLPEYLVTAVG